MSEATDTDDLDDSNRGLWNCNLCLKSFKTKEGLIGHCGMDHYIPARFMDASTVGVTDLKTTSGVSPEEVDYEKKSYIICGHLIIKLKQNDDPVIYTKSKRVAPEVGCSTKSVGAHVKMIMDKEDTPIEISVAGGKASAITWKIRSSS